METTFIDLMSIATMAKLWLNEEGRKNYYFEKEYEVTMKFIDNLKKLADETDEYERFKIEPII